MKALPVELHKAIPSTVFHPRCAQFSPSILTRIAPSAPSGVVEGANPTSTTTASATSTSTATGSTASSAGERESISGGGASGDDAATGAAGGAVEVTSQSVSHLDQTVADETEPAQTRSKYSSGTRVLKKHPKYLTIFSPEVYTQETLKETRSSLAALYKELVEKVESRDDAEEIEEWMEVSRIKSLFFN